MGVRKVEGRELRARGVRLGKILLTPNAEYLTPPYVRPPQSALPQHSLAVLPVLDAGCLLHLAAISRPRHRASAQPGGRASAHQPSEFPRSAAGRFAVAKARQFSGPGFAVSRA